MSIIDKVKNLGQETGGKAKQAAGGATGDRSMQADGFKDEKAGQAKQAGEHVKDALR